MNGGGGSGIAPLASLRLDRGLLTLFVVGAGFGESLLVALPGSDGWIIIDGAAPSSAPPAMEILQRYWSDTSRIELLLLTHPHADHYAGFLRILDDEALGPAVKRIGCVSHYLGVTHGHVLGREVEAAFEALDVDDPEARSELGRARSVLERIGDEWLRHPHRRWPALRGATLAFDGDVRLRVLGPQRAHVEAFFTAIDLGRRILDHANDLSVVADLHFGATRLVLGGDLPNVRNQQPVPSGWDHICSTFAGLNDHTGLKIAHHASKDAIHDQKPMPERVRRAELTPAPLTPRRPLGRLGRAVESGPVVKSPPTECVWAIQFDDRGKMVGRYRGEVATVVM